MISHFIQLHPYISISISIAIAVVVTAVAVAVAAVVATGMYIANQFLKAVWR